jgi:hypothetical protein
MAASSGTVTAAAAFPATADVTLPFTPEIYVLKVTVGTADISFDGTNSHLTLATGDTLISLPLRFNRMWVRQNGGAATLRWSAFTA